MSTDNPRLSSRHHRGRDRFPTPPPVDTTAAAAGAWRLAVSAMANAAGLRPAVVATTLADLEAGGWLRYVGAGRWDMTGPPDE